MKSLANTEMFPAGVGVAVNRDMLVWDDDKANTTVHVTVWSGRKFLAKNGSNWINSCEIPEKVKVPMTASDIAMLPRGTAFVSNKNIRLFNPAIYVNETGEIIVIESDLKCFKGYILPNETEIRKFTKEVEE